MITFFLFYYIGSFLKLWMHSIDPLWSIVVILHDKNDKKRKIKCINTHKYYPLNTETKKAIKRLWWWLLCQQLPWEPGADGPWDFMKSSFKVPWVRGCSTDLKVIKSSNTKNSRNFRNNIDPIVIFYKQSPALLFLFFVFVSFLYEIQLHCLILWSLFMLIGTFSWLGYRLANCMSGLCFCWPL